MMRIPTIQGVIDRRILVNYRIDPDVMARLLPPPFRPQLAEGYAIGGICLIRLTRLRPRHLPLPWGLTSENAAHRIAVTWQDGEQQRHGVFIPRRDTDSRMTALLGGRLFPGMHHHATFEVAETPPRYAVSLTSDDGRTRVAVAGRITESLSSTSVFGSLAKASAFFEAGSLGYSATTDPRRFDGLALHCHGWKVAPLDVERVESSYFGNDRAFPRGSVVFDCALLMREIRHEWHSREDLCCAPAASEG